ncbi:MAG: hypothetical protein JNJ63_06975 [Hyphomonadaceae bacterium]|nr:hypothetical protein [Hyphomonadaceae bacterium]
MQLISLLGAKLKAPATLELLRGYEDELRIRYIIDVWDDGIPDYYEAQVEPAGFLFQLNKNQTIYAIHCYIKPRYNFSPIDPALIGAPAYASVEAVVAAAHQLGCTAKTFEPFEGCGGVRQMASLHFGDHSRHYDFADGDLTEITLSLPTRDVP